MLRRRAKRRLPRPEPEPEYPVFLHCVSIAGYRNLVDVQEVSFDNVTLLIGENGSGKSSLLEALMLPALIEGGGLHDHLAALGGASRVLSANQGDSPQLSIDFVYKDLFYHALLRPDDDDQLYYARELADNTLILDEQDIDIGRTYESKIRSTKQLRPGVRNTLRRAMRQTALYSPSNVRSLLPLVYNPGAGTFARRGKNIGRIGGVLWSLKRQHPQRLATLEFSLRLIHPDFQRFDFVEKTGDTVEPEIEVVWKRQDTSYEFALRQMSVGAQRFMVLACVLLDPGTENILLFDEPELGLHPQAIAVLAGLIRKASRDRQIIVATQSPTLLSEFDISQIRVCRQFNGSVSIKPIDPNEYTGWLSDTSIGDLFVRNIIPTAI